MNAAAHRPALGIPPTARRVVYATCAAALFGGIAACTGEAGKTPSSLSSALPFAAVPAPEAGVVATLEANTVPAPEPNAGPAPKPHAWGAAAAGVAQPIPAEPAAIPVPVVPAPAPETLFAEETIFVAQEDVQTYTVRLAERMQVRLSLEIAEKVPLTVIVQPGRISAETYAMGLGVLTLGQVAAAFDDTPGKKVGTIDDLFSNRLSRRAAYGSFDSPWVTLAGGTYTIILDNSGEISPSRGDAPLHLRLYSRPAA